MSRRRIAAVIAALGLATLVAWWFLRDPAAHTEAPRAGSAGSAHVTAPRTSGPRAPAKPASVSGRVLRKADGRGVPGAQVAIARADLGAQVFEGDATPTVVVTTDAQGAWAAPEVAPGAYVIAATAAGLVPATRDKLVLHEGERAAGIDLFLDAGGIAVTGTVTDIGGGPISGARITVSRERFTPFGGAELIAVTRDDGTYELTLADGAYSATASHDDYTASTRRFELGGKPATIDFTLTPGATIRGIVVLRDGTPVPHAIVRASGGRSTQRWGFGTAAADDKGAFTVKGLGPGAISLTASGRGAASTSPTVVELGLGEQLDDVRVVVDRAYSISGTVVTRGTKQPLAGIRLGAFSIGSRQAAFAADPSAEDGAFEIIGVRPASYMLFALGEDVMPEVGQPVEVVDKDVTGVVVEMAAGVTISGRVDPPAIASISIAPKMIGFANMFEAVKSMLVRADSDATGAFTLRHVPAGTFTVSASTSDGMRGTIDLIVGATDKTGVVIPLERGASLAGRVVDARGAAVAGVRVHAEAQGDLERVEISFNGVRDPGVTTGPDGAFEIVGLDPGKVGVTVSDHQGTLKWANPTHKDKPREPITFELAKSAARTGITLTVETRDGVIRGVVLAPDGKPAADAWVTATLVEEDDDKLAMIRARIAAAMADTKPVLTGADGRFSFERLRKGTYQLVAESARGSSRIEKPGIKTGDTVTLQLASLGTLSGRVTAGGAPVTNYDLSCEDGRTDLDRDDVDRHVEDAAGAYKLERLPPADYTCTVVADAGRATAKVTVPAGEATLDLVLAPWATVTGTVVSVLTGQPVKGVKLMVSGEGADTHAIGDMLSGRGPTSDAAGRFTVTRVSPGKVKLVVLPAEGGFQQLASRDVEVKGGERVDVGTIKIVPPREGDAGTLGMSTEITDDTLAVATVKSGGPAEAAGVQVGDRIVSINGIDVTTLTPLIAQTLLSSGTMGPGQPFQLGLERAGSPVQATVVSVKW